jgi:hypothetical protein
MAGLLNKGAMAAVLIAVLLITLPVIGTSNAASSPNAVTSFSPFTQNSPTTAQPGQNQRIIAPTTFSSISCPFGMSGDCYTISCPSGSTQYSSCFGDLTLSANPGSLPQETLPIGTSAYLYTQIITTNTCWGITDVFFGIPWPITCPSGSTTMPSPDLYGYWSWSTTSGNVVAANGPSVPLLDTTYGYGANVLILKVTAITPGIVSISTGSNSINMVTNVIQSKTGDTIYGEWKFKGNFYDEKDPTNGGTSGTITGPDVYMYASLPVSICQPYSNVYTNGNISVLWTKEEPIALIAVLIAFSIAALIFVLGSAAKNDRVRNFGIGELYEAVASAIIVGLFIALAGTVVGGVPYHLLPVLGATPSTNVICDALNGVTGLITGSPNSPPGGVPLESIYASIVGTYETGVYITTTSVNITSTKVNFQYPPQIVSAIVYLTTMAPALPLSQVIVDSMYLLWTEYNLMILFTLIGPAFIATGVIFRALFFTRSFGGMLIALGLAFFLVMPTLFAFAFATYYTLPEPNFQYIYAFSYSNVINELQDIWLIALYYPILIIAITYAFVTQVANFIGASASTSRLRMGLI